MDLEKILIELEQDKTLFNKFNIFETLKITNTEIRHSNVLGWLLNPVENHNLKGQFLERFIEDISQIGAHDLDLKSIDYDAFEVKREWQNIDILVFSRKSKLVIVIENKIWSSESSHQLEKYRNIVDSEFRDYHIIYVFLTPYGNNASDPEIWITYDYEKIHNNIVITAYFKNIHHFCRN